MSVLISPHISKAVRQVGFIVGIAKNLKKAKH